jgi:hypothetical protein
MAADGMYVPGLHASQAVWAVSEVNLPTAHCRHSLFHAICDVYAPAAQLEHCEIPFAVLKVPAGHAMQAADEPKAEL